MSRDYAAEIAARGKDITSALNSGNPAGALKASLANPPYGCTDTGLKSQNITNISSVLKGIKKEADVDKAIEGLSQDELDVLTKYIYAVLSKEDPDSKLLFYWHSAVLKKSGGLGSVIRVLADKSNTVL